MTEKNPLCPSMFSFLYYKVKSVVMAKQTVINFLKTCINMYIVLLDPVWSNPKTGPNEAGTTWHVGCFCEVESVGITGDFQAKFLNRYFETHDGKYCTPGCPTLSTLVRIQKSNTDPPFSSLLLLFFLFFFLMLFYYTLSLSTVLILYWHIL